MNKKNSISDLFNLISDLRAPGGCPWDKKQTSGSMAKYLVEESCEAYEAIHTKSGEEIKDELGDVLFQLCFIIFLYQEKGEFSLEDIISHSYNKMVSRHPHVFSDKEVNSVDDVEKVWKEVKGKEKNVRQKSVFDSIPSGLPALMKAMEVSRAAVDVGFEWDSIDGVYDKVNEELFELKEAVDLDFNEEKKSLELGDVLFTMVNVGRFLKIESESSLLKSCDKFEKRFRWIEEQCSLRDKSVTDLKRDELESFWDKSKNLY